MPERPPAVIERMAAAYWNRRRAGQSRWEEIEDDARVEQCKDMLAAVKELRRFLSDEDHPEWFFAEVSDVMKIVIDHHERTHSKPDPG